MSKKDTFISVIDDLINSTDMEEFCGEANYNDVMSYWESFKNSKPTVEFTENGQKILQYMQDFKNAPLKAKEIGEGLFMSSRSVSGAIRKLVTDGYVDKTPGSPVMYTITDKGMAVSFDK